MSAAHKLASKDKKWLLTAIQVVDEATHPWGLKVTRILALDLGAEPCGLIFRVIELRESIRQFTSADEEFESVRDKRIGIIAAR